MEVLTFMKENQNESKSRGFYIALSICLVAVFISAFFAYSNINKIMVSNKEETEKINSSAIESSSNKHEKKDTNKRQKLQRKSLQIVKKLSKHLQKKTKTKIYFSLQAKK